MSGHQMKETAPSNEGKKPLWGFATLSVMIGGYGLFTAILLSRLGHLPGSKMEFIMLGAFFYSVCLTLWNLAFARRARPGLFTYLFGLAGVASLYYGLYFVA